MNLDFEQNQFCRTAKGSDRIVHERIRILNWMACFDRWYENKNYLNKWLPFYLL